MSSPEWAMVGYRDGDRFVIVASKTLTEAQLRADARVVRESMGTVFGRDVPVAFRYSISAKMDTVTVVNGDSYVDALRQLLEQWRPESAPRLGLEAGNGIEEGT